MIVAVVTQLKKWETSKFDFCCIAISISTASSMCSPQLSPTCVEHPPTCLSACPSVPRALLRGDLSPNSRPNQQSALAYSLFSPPSQCHVTQFLSLSRPPKAPRDHADFPRWRSASGRPDCVVKETRGVGSAIVKRASCLERTLEKRLLSCAKPCKEAEHEYSSATTQHTLALYCRRGIYTANWVFLLPIVCSQPVQPVLCCDGTHIFPWRPSEQRLSTLKCQRKGTTSPDVLDDGSHDRSSIRDVSADDPGWSTPSPAAAVHTRYSCHSAPANPQTKSATNASAYHGHTDDISYGRESRQTFFGHLLRHRQRHVAQRYRGAPTFDV